MYPKPFQNLIQHFSSLPSIGPKAAERIVLSLFKQDHEKIIHFAENLEALTALQSCSVCFNVSEGELCDICRNKERDQQTICVVEEALDIFAFERLGSYTGTYHVLGGVLDGSKNDEYKNLHIEHLIERIGESAAIEVIIGTNPTAEGDLTALFLKDKLSSIDTLSVTRLARGLTSGGDIEYVDTETLESALKHRDTL